MVISTPTNLAPPEDALPTGSILLDRTLTRAQNIHTLLRELRREAAADTRLIIEHPRSSGFWTEDNLLDCQDVRSELDAAGWEVVSERAVTFLSSRMPGDRLLAALPGFQAWARRRRIVARPRGRPAFKSPVSFSVVIPTPSQNAPLLILPEYLTRLARRTEIVFVTSDPIPDRLFGAIDLLGRRHDSDTRSYLAHPHRRAGWLGAVADGVEQSSGDVVVILEADPRVTSKSLTQLAELVFSGAAEVAIGNRFAYNQGINQEAHPWLARAFSAAAQQRFPDPLCPLLVASRHNAIRMLRLALTWSPKVAQTTPALLAAAVHLHLKTLSVAVRPLTPQEPEATPSPLTRMSQLRRGLALALRRVRFGTPDPTRLLATL